jgi:hypothetical protein
MANILCSRNKNGKCVVANRIFEFGDVIEIAPVLITNGKDKSIENYIYEWDIKPKTWALVLGCGSIYDHSYRPNASFHKDYNLQQMVYTSVRRIGVGDEITINYNGRINDKGKLWFKVR